MKKYLDRRVPGRGRKHTWLLHLPSLCNYLDRRVPGRGRKPVMDLREDFMVGI